MQNNIPHALPLGGIKVTDSFLGRYTQLVKSSMLPYQWDAINDRIPEAPPSHSLANIRIAAGEEEGEFYGVVFQDSDVGKWLEAAAYTLAAEPDKELEATADEVIRLIEKAQQPDGYFNTWFTLKRPSQRWKNLTEGHELYTAGHFIEAAVAYYEATGKRALLDCMCRFADLICKVFGPGENQHPGYPGHQEIELALVRLYSATGQKKYLGLARHFLLARGGGGSWFEKEKQDAERESIFPELRDLQPEYNQSHLPLLQQTTMEGHAVRALYMCAAAADVAALTNDTALMDTCKTLWNNMVQKRMFITGSVGSSGLLERFTTDYDLPNDGNYSETCASIAMAMFGLRMARSQRDASYIDIAERALYNTILSGTALDGQSFFYVNPMEVWPDACMPGTSRAHVKPVRQKWFGVACCPPNIARTLASLGQYIYSQDEDTLYVNLYAANEAETQIHGAAVRVQMQSNMPYEGRVTLRVQNRANRAFTLALRMPEYAEDYTVLLNGAPAGGRVEKGYLLLRGTFKDAEVSIAFGMRAQLVRANPAVRADAGRAAVQRGPLVYCFEEADNGKNLAALYLAPGAQPQEEYREDILGGVLTLCVDGLRLKQAAWPQNALYSDAQPQLEPVRLTAIPYCFWANRTPGEMAVWLKERL